MRARCTTSWLDPREEVRASPEQESDEGSRDDGAPGASADLATLCTGVAAKGGLAQWSRVVERSAYEALTKAIAGRRDAADEEQYPRYMLLQKLHHAVVRRLLTPPADLLGEDALWDRRGRAVEAAGGNPKTALQLPKDAVDKLVKHSAAGLTKSYKKHLFGATKLHINKARRRRRRRQQQHQQQHHDYRRRRRHHRHHCRHHHHHHSPLPPPLTTGAQDARRRAAAARPAAHADAAGAARAADAAADGHAQRQPNPRASCSRARAQPAGQEGCRPSPRASPQG